MEILSLNTLITLIGFVCLAAIMRYYRSRNVNGGGGA